ncbi:hypothetical protein BRAO375_3450003 [Bradyrhizobium sp. ORS 375]|uniref:hypothetical protein n=1 Tax=Bradyrhizobium sp. (strain ORS 375) TaxID=566679 RepID=UPI0002405E2A|nr:hypothetical protein [Bradyrhizobium sp. ORS 375]CCD94320.1 hypothetical protein BRAO375_3450003 [Bradyrhizobium sp. ORS 375]
MNMINPEDRTTALGLFNYARSYWRSAEQLRASKPDVSHPDAPILFLFYHSIELYMKAHVRNEGFDLQQLKEISHNILKAGRAAHQKGLQLTDDDFMLLTTINSDDNVVRSRYITTGAHTRPEEYALSDFCKYLDGAVSDNLISHGVTVHRKNFGAVPVSSSSVPVDDWLAEEVDSLSDKERNILAFLLHHNQRMFTCAFDYGHAATLVARGIIRAAVQPGQAFDPENMPAELPLEVWRWLRPRREQFPYTGTENDPFPWRKAWFE